MREAREETRETRNDHGPPQQTDHRLLDAISATGGWGVRGWVKSCIGRGRESALVYGDVVDSILRKEIWGKNLLDNRFVYN